MMIFLIQKITPNDNHNVFTRQGQLGQIKTHISYFKIDLKSVSKKKELYLPFLERFQ